MRFTTIAVSGAFAALAVAQSSAASENPSPVASLTPAQSSTAACLEDCADDDLNCQAHCVHVPSVSEDQANANTECSRNCDQGDGSPEQTEAFGRCLADCVEEHYYVTSSGTPEPTGAAGSGSGSGNNSSDEEATTTGGAAGGSNTSESSPGATESGDSDDSDAAQSSASDAAESGASQTSSAPSGTSTPEDEDSAARALVGSSIFALVAAIFAL